MKQYSLNITKEQAGERLDVFLAQHPKIPSRSYAQQLITKGLVKVGGRSVHKHHKVQEGELIEVQLPPPEEERLVPEEIPLKIIYEDSDIIIISKQAGMVVHPSAGHKQGTLVHALLAHSPELKEAEDSMRPGIVHRLDKDTSGLMVVAKNLESQQKLIEQLSGRKLTRNYLALVYGRLKEEKGSVDAPIGRNFRRRTRMAIAGQGSREAVTRYRVLERFKEYSLLEVTLETGRTHQIRVHMAFIKHPIVGDPEYGGKKTGRELNLGRQFLHAYRLVLVHPKTGKELSFEDSLPEDLERVVKTLRKEERGSEGDEGLIKGSD